jgi:hypothetical protein
MVLSAGRFTRDRLGGRAVNIGWALRTAANGHRVSRYDAGIFIELSVSSNRELPHIVLDVRGYARVPWSPTKEDIESEDWELVR